MAKTRKIPKCPRCGEDHGERVFQELTNSPIIIYGWWMCPTANEPVLLVQAVRVHWTHADVGIAVRES